MALQRHHFLVHRTDPFVALFLERPFNWNDFDPVDHYFFFREGSLDFSLPPPDECWSNPQVGKPLLARHGYSRLTLRKDFVLRSIIQYEAENV